MHNDPIPEIKYGALEGGPVRFTDTEAFICVDGKTWKPVNVAECLNYAGLMDQTEFNETYPGLPALPAEAFKP
jgi:hypothetical protein